MNATDETWKDIKDYEGMYQVSDLGRVKSLSRITKKKGGKISYRQPEKILSFYKTNTGYVMVHLYKDGKNKHNLVSRLVAQAFIPNPDNLPEVDHINHNLENNKPLNLRWCTPSQNKQNMRKPATNKTGYTGVKIQSHCKNKPYYASVKSKGKDVYLGSFKTAEEASRAYQEASQHFHAEFYCDEKDV